MLGPVLSAEDLATWKETDQVLSCSHGASTAGDSKQVTAHVVVMATMHFPYRVSQWGCSWHFSGQLFICSGGLACCKL